MTNMNARNVSDVAWGRFRKFLVLPASLALLLASLPAVAATPPPGGFQDITGVWVGSLSGSDFGCTLPANNGPFSDRATVTFSNQQSNGNFDVRLVAVSNQDGGTSILNGNGAFIGTNQTSFNVTEILPGDTTTVGFSTNISGIQMTFSFSGNSTGDGCNFSGSGSVTRTGGNLTRLNPETEASSTVTGQLMLGRALAFLTGGLTHRAFNALHGGPGGGRPNITTGSLSYEGNTGMNAGDGGIPYGVWGNYTYTDFDNDLSSTASDGHSHNLLGGIDFTPLKGTVLGVAVGYSLTDTDTSFNLGNQEDDTFTIAPYFGALINDTWSIDASIGFSRINTDQFRARGVPAPVTSSPSADRWFGTINLNGVTYFNNWIIGGRVGVLRAKNTQDSFVESNGAVVPKIINQLGTLSIGTDVAYSFGKYEPFASLTYENDYRLTKIAVVTGAQPANDRDDFLLGLGVRYFGSNGLSGNLEWNKRLGRTNFDEDIFSFSLRAEF